MLSPLPMLGAWHRIAVAKIQTDGIPSQKGHHPHNWHCDIAVGALFKAKFSVITSFCSVADETTRTNESSRQIKVLDLQRT
jgi:hypothetical protein